MKILINAQLIKSIKNLTLIVINSLIISEGSYTDLNN